MSERKEVLQPVLLRIPAEHKAWLREQAAKEQRSINFIIRKMISDAVEKAA